MAVKLVWRSQARADLREIILTIAAQQPRAAERYLDAMQAKAAQLMQHPRMGARRPDIAPSARVLIEAPFLLLYKIDPDTDAGPVNIITVVRVVDGRRDLGGLFTP